MRLPVKSVCVLIAVTVGIMATVVAPAAAAVLPVVGQGFTITPGDLAFILKQIKIAERHSNVLQGKDTELPAIPPNPNPVADPIIVRRWSGRAPTVCPTSSPPMGCARSTGPATT